MTPNRVQCITCQQKALQKKPTRCCPGSAAPASSHGALIPTAFQKSMCKEAVRATVTLDQWWGYGIHQLSVQVTRASATDTANT